MKQPDTKTVNRVVLSSLIGATIEWYDCHSACNIDPVSRGIGVQN